MNDSYSLNYSAPVTLGLFKNHMKSMTKSDANYAFSRILVPLNRHGVIYFMDDHSLNVYTAQINVQAIGKMSSLITRRDIKMVRVEYRLFNGHITKYFLQPIEVPKSSYLINRENTGLFVTRLIGSNENSSVTTREQKKQTIYTDDAGQRMVIKNHNGYVSYTNYAKEIAEARHRSLYDSLNLSFDRLKLLDVALDDVRYSEFDFQSKMPHIAAISTVFRLFQQMSTALIRFRSRTAEINIWFSRFIPCKCRFRPIQTQFSCRIRMTSWRA